MPAQIFGTAAVVTMLNRAFNDVSPSNATFNNQVAAAGSTEESQYAFAKTFGAGYTGLTADALSTLILGNLGVLPNTALQTAVKDYITAAGVANVGIVALQLGQILSNLENATGDQAVFKAAATAWNNEVTGAYNYSANPANTTPSGNGPVVQPGTSYSLTDKIGEAVNGTSSNDTFKAVVGDGTTTTSTLNLGDSVDGGAGTDTLNLVITTNGQVPNGVTIKNIEVVNVDVTTAGTAAAHSSYLTSSLYEGVKELWQVNANSTGAATTAGNFASVTVGDGIVAGFRGGNQVEGTAAATATGAADVVATVTTATVAQKALTVALDGVGSASALTFAATAGGKVETIDVTGKIAGETSSKAGALSINAGADALTLNVALTSAVNINAVTGAKLKTLDLSKSTGAVEINATGLTKLESIKGGSASDKITINLDALAIVVDAGAGNDTVTVTDGAAGTGSIKESTITLGAGKDTLVISGLSLQNVEDTADLAKGAVTVTDFKIGDDTLNLGTKGAILTAGQLATAKEAATLKAAIDSVAAAIGVGKSAVFSYGADAYVFVDATSNGAFGAGDGLIKLTGVDATQLSTTQNGGLVL